MIGEVLAKNKYISPLFHALQHEIINLIYLFINLTFLDRVMVSSLPASDEDCTLSVMRHICSKRRSFSSNASSLAANLISSCTGRGGVLGYSIVGGGAMGSEGGG